MGLRNENPLLSSNHSRWKRRPPLCHPEQQTCLRQVEGEMNELCEAVTTTITPNGRVTLPFVIPSAAEGSAVLRAIPGNVFDGTPDRRDGERVHLDRMLFEREDGI
jgi:hypothetical protein